MQEEQVADSFLVGDGHQFAFYMHDLKRYTIESGKQLVFVNAELAHRLHRVVRLKNDETFIVFDKNKHAFVQLQENTVEKVVVLVLFCSENKKLQPALTFLLPVLKKDALEQAIYALVELGATEIQPVITKKSQTVLAEKERVRLEKIMITAAEQSKNYAFATLHSTKSLQETLNGLSLNSDKIVFDISGVSLLDVQKQMIGGQLYLLVGPEGGLTAQELLMIKEAGFKACTLTKTVLRALQAVTVGTALFRVS